MSQTKFILEALNKKEATRGNFRYYDPQRDYWDLDETYTSRGELIKPVVAEIEGDEYNVYILIFGYNHERRGERLLFLNVYSEENDTNDTYEMVSKEFNPDDIDQVFEYGNRIFIMVKDHRGPLLPLLIKLKYGFPELEFREIFDAGTYTPDDLVLLEGESDD